MSSLVRSQCVIEVDEHVHCRATRWNLGSGSSTDFLARLIPSRKTPSQREGANAPTKSSRTIPGMERPNPLRYMQLKGDRIPRYINPRRMSTAQDLNQIRIMFPTAIGVRVLIAGFVVVMFHTMSDMTAS